MPAACLKYLYKISEKIKLLSHFDAGPYYLLLIQLVKKNCKIKKLSFHYICINMCMFIRKLENI